MSAWAEGAKKKGANGHDRKQCPLGNGQTHHVPAHLAAQRSVRVFSPISGLLGSPRSVVPAQNALELTTGTRLRQSHPLYSLQGPLKLCSVRGGGGVISPCGRGLCKNKGEPQGGHISCAPPAQKKGRLQVSVCSYRSISVLGEGSCGVRMRTLPSPRFLTSSIYLM